jgi:signal transduction histidine kinase
VEDECGGLPAGEDLLRPFEQRSSDQSGIGLGLTIVRDSIVANDGEIRVRNMPGRGCVFIVDLPRLAHQGQRHPPGGRVGQMKGCRNRAVSPKT